MANRLLYRHVGAVHALSPAEANDIRRLFPGKTVYCVPQGPNIRTQDPAIVRSNPRSVGDLLLLFVGRLDVYTKGLDLLLDAFAAAQQQLGGCRLVLLLAGPDWAGGLASLRERAIKLGIHQQVEFSGALSGAGIAGVLSEADVYIQLSRHEGFPLSIAEALLAGIPTIMSREVGTASYAEISGLPHVRIVRPNVDEAASAIVDFAKRIETLRKAAAGFQSTVADFFSWPRVAALHVEHYEALCRA